MALQRKTDPVIPLTFMICIMLMCFCFVAGMTKAAAMDSTSNYGESTLQRAGANNLSKREPLIEVNRATTVSGFGTKTITERVGKQTPINERFGDRMYIIQPGDQPAMLALELTGTAYSWPEIARYNQMDEISQPEVGRLIYIPHSLVESTSTVDNYNDALTGTKLNVQKEGISSLVRGTNSSNLSSQYSNAEATERPVRSDAQLLALAFDQSQDSSSTGITSNITTESDFKVATTGNLAGTAVASLTDIVSDTAERNVNMFAGEARVFGKVAVNRVAVGNGAIIRAEVLDNGELLAIAQTEGSSSLHLWHKDGSHSSFNVRVTATDPEIRVRLDKTIRMRVKMIEFRKTALERIGIDWGDNIEGPVFATVGDAATNSLFRPSQEGILGDSSTLPLSIKPFSSYFGVATQLSSRINLLVNKGDAEMLAEPVLSCENGGTARFLAGGEVPYPTVGINGQTTVDFREYGIRLEISPRVDEFNNIQADIMTEVSSIDSSVTVLGAPGLLTRRTQTQVSTRAGNTIVIAGLMQIEQGSDKDSLPGLGKLPVLGKLFRSDSSNKTVSELVIFITPEVVEPGKPGLQQREDETHQYVLNELQEARRQLQQFRNQ